MKKLLFLLSFVFVIVATVLPTQTATASVADEVGFVIPQLEASTDAVISIPYDWLEFSSETILNNVEVLKTVSIEFDTPIDKTDYKSIKECITSPKTDKKGIGLIYTTLTDNFVADINLKTDKKGIGLIYNSNVISSNLTDIKTKTKKTGIGLI